jgi:hypothetical protein
MAIPRTVNEMTTHLREICSKPLSIDKKSRQVMRKMCIEACGYPLSDEVIDFIKELEEINGNTTNT